jgi:hypothetical protein
MYYITVLLQLHLLRYSINTPAAQVRHALEPFSTLYVPGTQAWHNGAMPVYPSLHEQLFKLLLPVSDHDCPGQGVHVSAVLAFSTAL